MTSESPTPPDRPHGTPVEPHVAVRGEAVLHVEPEIATISVTARARGDHRRTVAELTRLNGELLAVIKEYGEAVEAVASGVFSVIPQFKEGRRPEKVDHYDGTVRISVTFTDFAALGEAAVRLAGHETTGVMGPQWALRRHSPAHREARQEALRDAVRRAHDYAGVMGTQVVGLLEIVDEGTGAGTFHEVRQSATARVHRDGFVGVEDAAPVLDLEPRRQTVRAAVKARFVLGEPAIPAP